jgi:hypothetical protein|tara:strand:+ start:389 stop:745 length:357 start_codon:yes stop_codon:yes gene_type:complete
MHSIQDETLEQCFERLRQKMVEAKQTGVHGETLAQRIEGDLHRLINSSWLNCSELIYRHEREQQGLMPVAANAAIEYAVKADDGKTFLMHWQAGDFDAIRKGWPDAPPAIFVSRDLLN